MTLRELIFELLNAGTDNLDTPIVFYSEIPEGWGKFYIEAKNILDVSMNCNCIQLYMHD